MNYSIRNFLVLSFFFFVPFIKAQGIYFQSDINPGQLALNIENNNSIGVSHYFKNRLFFAIKSTTEIEQLKNQVFQSSFLIDVDNDQKFKLFIEYISRLSSYYQNELYFGALVKLLDRKKLKLYNSILYNKVNNRTLFNAMINFKLDKTNRESMVLLVGNQNAFFFNESLISVGYEFKSIDFRGQIFVNKLWNEHFPYLTINFSRIF